MERDPSRVLSEIKLLHEIKKMLEVFDHKILKELPEDSWQVTASLDNGVIYINVQRNDDLLVENGWGQLADPTAWLHIWLPKIAHFLRSREHIIFEETELTFSVKSEEEEWRTTKRLSDLIFAAKSGVINEFGSMMTFLDPQVVKIHRQLKIGGTSMSEADNLGAYLGIEITKKWADKGEEYIHRLTDTELEDLRQFSMQTRVLIEMLIQDLVKAGKISAMNEDEWVNNVTNSLGDAVSAAFGYGYEKGLSGQ